MELICWIRQFTELPKIYISLFHIQQIECLINTAKPLFSTSVSILLKPFKDELFFWSSFCQFVGFCHLIAWSFSELDLEPWVSLLLPNAASTYPCWCSTPWNNTTVSLRKSHLEVVCSSCKKSLEHSVDDTELNFTLTSPIAVYLDLLTQNPVLLTSTSAMLLMFTCQDLYFILVFNWFYEDSSCW